MKRYNLTDEQQLYKLLEHFFLYSKYGDMFYANVNAYDANLTVCPECRVDDFCHVEGCWLEKLKIKDINLISPYHRKDSIPPKQNN